LAKFPCFLLPYFDHDVSTHHTIHVLHAPERHQKTRAPTVRTAHRGISVTSFRARGHKKSSYLYYSMYTIMYNRLYFRVIITLRSASV